MIAAPATNGTAVNVLLRAMVWRMKVRLSAACPLLGVGASGREVGTEVMVAWALAYIKALCV